MEIFNKFSLDKATELIQNAEKIILTAHLNPDGDALGSTLALYNIFKKQDKVCSVVLPNNIPDTFKWMPSCNDIKIWNSELEDEIKNADLIGFDFYS